MTPDTASVSPGFKKMGNIYKKEFIDNKAYNEKWGKLTSHLKKVFKKPVHGYGDLFGGGFVGEVIIEEDRKPEFIRHKSLKFYVSILGPFFAIHGIDSSVALLQIESHNGELDTSNFEATHAITISPVFEYQEVFNKLEEELRSFFPGYLFVPYNIGMSTKKNISVADELRDPRSFDTIYEALFGVQAVHDCLTRGDEYYGINDWVKSLTQKEKFLIDSISQHILTASNEITIHKVWKLQKSKQLETFKVWGNLMFGMDLFDVIDLTDKSKFIMISKERGAPSSGKYKISDEVIEINTNVSLRIIQLSKTSLTLNLILNFEHGDVSVKGEAMELKFVQMKIYEIMQEYLLEKWIWTVSDFEKMGWHDATMYGVRLNKNLEIDLDYIFQWNQPEVEGFHFTFWVAPRTLVFESPKELSFELTQSFNDKWLEIQDIEVTVVDNERHWTIITQQGDMSFISESFKQIVRKLPSLQLGQAVPYDERGGFSFGLTPGDSSKIELRPEILQRRKKQFEDYELAKGRLALDNELEKLNEMRDSGLIQTKGYLLKKKELNAKIDSLTFQLKGYYQAG